MSGTNNSGIWNQYGQGTLPMTGNEVILASVNGNTGATMANYTTAQLAEVIGVVLKSSASYANDAAAAAGGVNVGQLYRNGSLIQVRVT